MPRRRHVSTPFMLVNGRWVDPYAQAPHLLWNATISGMTNVGSFGRGVYGTGAYGVQR